MSEMQSKKERQSEESRKEDEKLIAEAIAGNQLAYTRLRNKYVGVIERLVRRMTTNEEDAEDIVQETFVKAFRALGAYNHQFAFSTWLYKIASNACIDFMRKRKLKTVSIHQAIQTDEGEVEMEIGDDSYAADEPLHSDEKIAILRKAMEELPEKYRVVIHLRHEEDMDYNQIAEHLNLPLGTVKAHLFRAREMLYKKLKKHETHFFGE